MYLNNHVKQALGLLFCSALTEFACRQVPITRFMTIFSLLHTDTQSKARAGIVHTDHGDIETPIFMPVGTQGTVKALQQRELIELDAQIILGNTYHLYLRPGEEVLAQLGGLHRFMNWQRPILTDSGGFQVFSLKELTKLTEEGATFSSHIDGSRHLFTPERVVEIQRCIGSDILMQLDECTPYPASYDYAKTSMERSLRWAERSKAAWQASSERYGHRQFLFGIGQGSIFADLRTFSLERLIELDLPGYAIGGLAVGEDSGVMYEMVDVSTDLLPKDKPRYLMGVGTPENILECIERGVDMFDCVMPTRNARNATLFTSYGKINLRNAKHKFSDAPIDETIDSYASRNFSLAYLRHLFNVDEILALQLATHHNIAFYLWLVKTARQRILDGTFSAWKQQIITQMNSQTTK
jgi:queuine tRNA-ribosyltransferase